jgi:predicted nucleic acid-binding protein
LSDPGVVDLPAEVVTTACALMNECADRPMDFADASLVVLAVRQKDGHRPVPRCRFRCAVT